MGVRFVRSPTCRQLNVQKLEVADGATGLSGRRGRELRRIGRSWYSDIPTADYQVVWWRFPRSTWETFKASADGKKFRDLRDPVETAAYMWLPVLRFLTRWLRKVWKFGVAALCVGWLVTGVVAMTGNSCAN